MVKPRPVDRRRGTLRRQLGDLVISPHDGRASEAKLFSIAGKSLCVWLILWHTKAVLETEWTLVVLLCALIAPELLKAAIKARISPASPRS